MRDSLLPLIVEDEGQISLGPRRLTIRQLKAVLDYQGFYSAVRYRYYPVSTLQGYFLGWRRENRVFGA